MGRLEKEYPELEKDKSKRRKTGDRIVDGFDLLIELAGVLLRIWS